MRHTAPSLAAALTTAALLVCLAAPAMAKEFLQARLDEPIAMDTPPGTEILVGVSVDDGADGPVVGSPIHLILTGRDGSTTRAAGAVDGVPGHYVMRIVIPAGGARDVEVVMHGTSDLPIMLTGQALTFGPVTARTAQVAPPLAPPMTPFPRASAAGPAVAVSVPAPAPAPAGPPPVLVVGLAALVVALAVAAIALLLRSRASRRAGVVEKARGA